MNKFKMDKQTTTENLYNNQFSKLPDFNVSEGLDAITKSATSIDNNARQLEALNLKFNETIDTLEKKNQLLDIATMEPLSKEAQEILVSVNDSSGKLISLNNALEKINALIKTTREIQTMVKTYEPGDTEINSTLIKETNSFYRDKINIITNTTKTIQHYMSDLNGTLPLIENEARKFATNKIMSLDVTMKEIIAEQKNANVKLFCHVVANGILNFSFWQKQKKWFGNSDVFDGDEHFQIPNTIKPLIDIVLKDEYRDWINDAAKAQKLLDALSTYAIANTTKTSNGSPVRALYEFLGNENKHEEGNVSMAMNSMVSIPLRPAIITAPQLDRISFHTPAAKAVVTQVSTQHGSTANNRFMSWMKNHNAWPFMGIGSAVGAAIGLGIGLVLTLSGIFFPLSLPVGITILFGSLCCLGTTAAGGLVGGGLGLIEALVKHVKTDPVVTDGPNVKAEIQNSPVPKSENSQTEKLKPLLVANNSATISNSLTSPVESVIVTKTADAKLPEVLPEQSAKNNADSVLKPVQITSPAAKQERKNYRVPEIEEPASQVKRRI